MVSEPTWLTRRVVQSIHDQQIREHGGRHGVRDEGLIASALARPQNRWGYTQDVDLPELAAAYGFGLTKNHGFIDGNKRVGYMAMYVFLGTNGLDVEAPEEEVVNVMTRVASGEWTEDELAAWLRERVIPYE